MRILVVADVFPAVSQTFIDLHVKSLLDRGHDVKLLATPGKSASASAAAPGFDWFIPAPYPNGSRWKKMAWPLRIAFAGNRRASRLAAIVMSDYVRGRTAGGGLAAIPYAEALRRDSEWDLVHVHFGYTAISVSQLYSARLLGAHVGRYVSW